MSDLIEHVAEDAVKVAVPEIGVAAEIAPLVDVALPVVEAAPVAEVAPAVEAAPVAETAQVVEAAPTEDELSKAAIDYAAPHIATLEESISSLPAEIAEAAKTALSKLKEMFTL